MLAADPEWRISRLASEIELQLARQRGVELSVSLLLCGPVVAPPHEATGAYYTPGSRVTVLGDTQHPGSARQHINAQYPGTKHCDEAPPPEKKISVTILTGFLGAGKTTLLNHLLHEQRDRRIAVIENEFGEVALDGDLLASKGSRVSAAEQVIVLGNGCMCCSVRGDILSAFAAVLERVRQGNPLDAVLIETTGMADPVPIVRTLAQTPAIAEAFYLNGVVTLVDAKNADQRLDEGSAATSADALGAAAVQLPVDEAVQQILFADRIILNKVDLVSAGEPGIRLHVVGGSLSYVRQQLEACLPLPDLLLAAGADAACQLWQRLRVMNSSARITSCVRGQLDPKEISDFQAFCMDRAAQDVVAADGYGGEDHGHRHGPDHGHEDHEPDAGCDNHSHGYEQSHHSEHKEGCLECAQMDDAAHHATDVGTFSIVRKGMEVDPLLFARWTRRIATAKPEDVGRLYRCKAVLSAAGSPNRLVFHAVADVMERVELGSWPPGEMRSCRIVFIGKNLNRAFFEESFLETLRPIRAPPLRREQQKHCLARLLHDAPALFYRVLRFCSSRDVARLGMTCCCMADAVFGRSATQYLQQLGCSRGLHPQPGSGKPLHLHCLVSMAVIRRSVRGPRFSGNPNHRSSQTAMTPCLSLPALHCYGNTHLPLLWKSPVNHLLRKHRLAVAMETTS